VDLNFDEEDPFKGTELQVAELDLDEIQLVEKQEQDDENSLEAQRRRNLIDKSGQIDTINY
jgi:hypothetical protein